MSQTAYNVITASAAVLALVVAIGIAFYQRRKKSLEYFGWISPIANDAPPEIASERLKILYDGKQVRALFHCTMFLHNNGNIGIAPADYTEQVRVAVAEEETILEAWCGLFPDKLEQVPVSGSVAVLPKLLINAGEQVQVSLLMTGSEAPTVSARILDTRIAQRPRVEQPPQKPANLWVAGIVLPAAVALIVVRPDFVDRALSVLILFIIVLTTFVLGGEVGKSVAEERGRSGF